MNPGVCALRIWISRDSPGVVHQLGADTRQGIAAVLDMLMDEMAEWRGADITGLWVATLLPVWKAAYLDLGRPHLLPRLTALAQEYARVQCRCATPHPQVLPAE